MRNIRVGIRDAKIHLSRYLKLVQKGKEVILTDHGKPVGKIVPVAPKDLSLQDRIARLVAQGVLESRTGEPMRSLPPPLPIHSNGAQRLLQEDRDGYLH